MPGFRAWLDAALAGDTEKLLSAEEFVALGGTDGIKAILDRRAWPRSPETMRLLEPILPRLAARYLLIEGRAKRALDPVANFHLSNGARVERINFLADTSEKGMRESAGLMVNYLYDPARIDQNHEDYAGEGKRNAATAVRRLARGWNAA
jgi:malonyl-CoA decarboxylase